jgi:hypothetical protein
VSSLAGAAAGRAAANGKGTRTATRAERANGEGSSPGEDLEDLPF